MVFPVVMYGCDSWTIKKTEHWRTDAFELWCWRRLFESSLDCKQIKPVNPKGNQPWVFTGRADVGADAPILWPPDAKSWLIGKKPWCWERLKMGGGGDDRGWDGWMASPTWWTWVWVGYGSSWWTRKPGMLQSMGSPRFSHDWATEMSWAELNWTSCRVVYFTCGRICSSNEFPKKEGLLHASFAVCYLALHRYWENGLKFRIS